jgi:hypothetical protein
MKIKLELTDPPPPPPPQVITKVTIELTLGEAKLLNKLARKTGGGWGTAPYIDIGEKAIQEIRETILGRLAEELPHYDR